ncbi:hypothetical protein VF04_36210 [Nostoc linckia z7]|uniref:Uncharacterized protein n=2 Tax=Nostoc linckia TaxID=92942 RepID=A0A9Q5Z6R4_NOSLI|nr:hypothetical protein VF02_22475 [Nostoc linckia z1]PHJ64015.1 hypothetical protein VF05_23445 [Nostoc linckia z3]PHJ76416.1 hypothetical protein VF03_08010 [Nostoc linckia z2]PHJ83134.1 hypothetical protein VF06_13515 [Nostoc linckia z4]PHJ84506.1 hypothetical protein VF04_36210 [Nostoc linckia z7]PHJ96338.1 hypothetical protein VF08_30475 [Nostoc linckia z8]PHK20829.1 hypothetical protein VF11_10770 [Nostoc linckia z14]PHK23906.1 hypothetical protein VF10_14155 [Nostoc linckia z13]PHK39
MTVPCFGGVTDQYGLGKGERGKGKGERGKGKGERFQIHPNLLTPVGELVEPLTFSQTTR